MIKDIIKKIITEFCNEILKLNFIYQIYWIKIKDQA